MDYEKFLMFGLIVLIVAIVIYGATSIFGSGIVGASVKSNEEAYTGFQTVSSGSTEQGDVSIDLTPHSLDNGKLSVDISVNTHSVDLSQFDLKRIVSLQAGGILVNPIEAPILEGHHSSGTLVFDTAEEIKEFKITITGIPAVEERTFEWKVPVQDKSGKTPRIELTPATKDLGDVSQAKGTLSTDFTVKNTGKADLVFSDMETSCMCTTAKLMLKEEESPIFGMKMHGNPKGWKASLKPGEEATLRVFYDPNVHGELRGPITRVITLYSNDQLKRKSSVKIKLNQVA
ncbi:DUF1573 domain-containing protein [Candidatus Woesearchaeota archaeon]|nr:DUF1573 domain-containing protein [Candidatus Woesearchaeota archaeon]